MGDTKPTPDPTAAELSEWCQRMFGVFSSPGPKAWECPRCHNINAPHIDQCNCQPENIRVEYQPKAPPEWRWKENVVPLDRGGIWVKQGGETPHITYRNPYFSTGDRHG